MKTFRSISLNKNSKEPIYRQLGDALLSLIAEGILPPDSKLPPIRKMSQSLHINNSTVVNAYQYLQSKQAVYKLGGSGTYVASPEASCSADAPLPPPTLPAAISPKNILADFSSFGKGGGDFPLPLIQAASTAALEKHGAKILIPQSPQGYPPLLDYFRSQLPVQERRADCRGIYSTTGLRQALMLVGRVLLKRGDAVLLEAPCPALYRSSLSRLGVFCSHVAMDEDGLNLHLLEEALKTLHPKLLVLSPYFQVPTNICTSAEKKTAILALCAAHRCRILEVDAYSGYAQKDVHPLYTMAAAQEVVYVKNLTKIPLPAFDTTVCLFPQKLFFPAENQRYKIDDLNNPLLEKIVYELLTNNEFKEFEKKIVRSHQISFRKIAHFVVENSSLFCGNRPFSAALPPGHGHWLHLRKPLSQAIARRAAQNGILLTPGDVYDGDNFSEYLHLRVQNCPQPPIDSPADSLVDSPADSPTENHPIDKPLAQLMRIIRECSEA